MEYKLAERNVSRARIGSRLYLRSINRCTKRYTMQRVIHRLSMCTVPFVHSIVSSMFRYIYSIIYIIYSIYYIQSVYTVVHLFLRIRPSVRIYKVDFCIVFRTILYKPELCYKPSVLFITHTHTTISDSLSEYAHTHTHTQSAHRYID